MAKDVTDFEPRGKRVVILGGGTGLSTVVGGNSQMPDWAQHPFVGLKQHFPLLHVIVCTTDDGGSTGRLLQCLPMIGIGDLRKSCLSLVRLEELQQRYGASEQNARDIIRIVQSVFNYRFAQGRGGRDTLQDPLQLIPYPQRNACPAPLARYLRELWTFCTGKSGPCVDPAGHSLGNLLITAAVFRVWGRTDRPPGLRAIQAGLDEIASHIGTTPRLLHPATATPGELRYRYSNGVEVWGQSKSASARRRCPVEKVTAEFAANPAVSQAVCRAITEADLILYAPGSLYSSIIPILQIPAIVAALRSNRRGLKILGANSWIQEGETDISLRREGRGFLVSELIEAYDRNIEGGSHGLFDIVLSANLDQIPSNILRNYALEGKTPIHLDRARVTEMGLQPVEASLLSPDYVKLALVIHHDARKFALAVKTLLWASEHLADAPPLEQAGQSFVPRPAAQSAAGRPAGRLLCRYLDSIRDALAPGVFRPEGLRHMMLDLAWENRDIRPRHLRFFREACLVPETAWGRSTAWDNVLGYYDPEDSSLKLHQKLLGNPAKLRENLLIALGESLLGRYLLSRTWIEEGDLSRYGSRCYEVQLRPPSERECLLEDAQLREYLTLARMAPDAADNSIFRIVLSKHEAFLPPGVLFGLMFAWYLNNSYAATLEYEMSLLLFAPETLLPHQVKERARKQALVSFFRDVVFGLPGPRRQHA